jgi:hypothetical protein
MENESLPIIYTEDGLILPYIVAFTPSKQDEIILGPEQITRNENDFISNLNRSNDDIISSLPFAGAFPYNNEYLSIYITFPTEAKEQGSNRSGLYLTLGALVHNTVFDNYIPCRYFMEYYLLLFCEKFSLDLKNSGSTDFIEKLKCKSDQDFIKKLNGLKEYLKLSLFQFKKTPSPNVFVKLYRKLLNQITKNSFPQFILCMEDENPIDRLLLFFSTMDEYIQLNKSTTVSLFASSEHFNKAVVLIPCLPNHISDIFRKGGGKAVINVRNKTIWLNNNGKSI